jgi:hypothetical protein
MKSFKLIVSGLLLAGVVVSCDDLVNDVDPLIDVVDPAVLAQEGEMDFVATGVFARMTQVYDNLTSIAEGLGDAFFFDPGNPNSTFPTFRDIDQGNIERDNNSVDGPYETLMELRMLADSARNVAARLTWENAALEASVKYRANVGRGMAYYWLAAYFGNTQTTSGAPIDGSAIIPGAQLLSTAVTALTEARATASASQTRIVNSLLAKVHLLRADYAAATTAALAGMVEGDAPFRAVYNSESQNTWFSVSGPARIQYLVDDRFVNYILAEPAEANRIPILQYTANGVVWQRQNLAPAIDSPLDIVSWQENNLMLAELALRGQAAAGDALALVNAVRASHGLSALAAVDLDVIYEERDKELFMQGQRIIDQRRFGRFHLQQGQTYTYPTIDFTVSWTPWQYFPITSQEVNANENVEVPPTG